MTCLRPALGAGGDEDVVAGVVADDGGEAVVP